MELQEMIRKAIEIGQRTGFITFDELNEISPEERSPDDVGTLLEALNAEGIQLTE
jgi:hypothetical protein